MKKTFVRTDKAFMSKSPLSQAVRMGNMLFVSGQVPVDSGSMTVVSEEFKSQVHHVLQSLNGIMEAAGGTLQDIGKVTVFLTDMSRFHDMNDIYKQYFADNPPSRTCVGVKELPRKSQVEMEAIAIMD